MARQGWDNNRSSGGGFGRYLLLLLLMALAAAGGWVLGDDELLGHAGALWEGQSASAAPASPRAADMWFRRYHPRMRKRLLHLHLRRLSLLYGN